jgi:hypothetical protein
MKAAGYGPGLPILIMPGLASSSLQVEESTDAGWKGEVRVLSPHANLCLRTFVLLCSSSCSECGSALPASALPTCEGYYSYPYLLPPICARLPDIFSLGPLRRAPQVRLRQAAAARDCHKLAFRCSRQSRSSHCCTLCTVYYNFVLFSF